MSTETPEAINDDVFDYDGGEASQCISGFGRNAVERAREAIGMCIQSGCVEPEEMEAIKWHIEELVRWCRHFNGEVQRLRKGVKA